jgi:hypothetical protein
MRVVLEQDAGYRIEEEVRFVLCTNPIATSDLGGILIDVDAKALIKDFKISPELPPPEEAYMERFVPERLGLPSRSVFANRPNGNFAQQGTLPTILRHVGSEKSALPGKAHIASSN